MMVDLNVVWMAVHVAVCVMMALLLWSYRQGRSMGERHYRQVLMTISFMIGARILPDVLFLTLGFTPQTYDVMTLFLRPMINLAELWAGFFIVYRSVHASAKYLQLLYYSGWTILVLLLLHPVLFVEFVRWGNMSVTMDDYVAYCHSLIGRIQQVLLYVLLVWVFVSNVLTLIYLYVHIARSGRQSNNVIGSHLRRVYLACAGVMSCYVVVLGLASYFDDNYWMLWLLLVAAMDYLVLTYVLNHHMQFLYYEREVQNMAMRVLRSQQRILSEDEVDWQSREQEVVYRLLEDWSKRPDRPFDCPGLTLQQLADELHLPADVLLEEGMSVYGMRFEEYICLLRGK